MAACPRRACFAGNPPNADEATQQWQAAVVADPRLGEAHNNLAVVYLQAGRFADADREVKLAEKSGLRVNPQFKEDLRKASPR
jgi:Tfp pilus assembly protein PilF